MQQESVFAATACRSGHSGPNSLLFVMTSSPAKYGISYGWHSWVSCGIWGLGGLGCEDTKSVFVFPPLNPRPIVVGLPVGWLTDQQTNGPDIFQTLASKDSRTKCSVHLPIVLCYKASYLLSFVQRGRKGVFCLSFVRFPSSSCTVPRPLSCPFSPSVWIRLRLGCLLPEQLWMYISLHIVCRRLLWLGFCLSG